MRELDRFAISHGMPGSVLMENAGRAVSREALKLASESGTRHVEVVCGPGNNGGDGFVAARHLAIAGLRVRVLLACDADRVSGEAGINLRLVQGMGIPVEPCATASLRPAAAAIDGLLGTGAAGAPRGAIAAAVDALANHDGPIVAVDVPSGVDADTGRVAGSAVRADVTVTFGYAKPGLLVYPGANYAGRVVVDPIGYNWQTAAAASDLPPAQFEWFDGARAAETLPDRPPTAHKGHFGHVLVVGGSVSMPGAPALAARAALLCGAGLVTIATPASVHAIVAQFCPEAMCVPLPDDKGALFPGSMSALARALPRATVVCLGPGMSLSDGAQAFARDLVEKCEVPLVVDADALTALAGHGELSAHRGAATVLTPHPGECGRLIGIQTEQVQHDRFAAVHEVAERYGATAVLKGARTLICGHDNRDGIVRTAIVTEGNPGMATGGSGDVLTGAIGAMLAQGCSPYAAAALGVYVHARAGDLASAAVGEHGLTAGAIAGCLPTALRELRMPLSDRGTLPPGWRGSAEPASCRYHTEE